MTCIDNTKGRSHAFTPPDLRALLPDPRALLGSGAADTTRAKRAPCCRRGSSQGVVGRRGCGGCATRF